MSEFPRNREQHFYYLLGTGNLIFPGNREQHYFYFMGTVNLIFIFEESGNRPALMDPHKKAIRGGGGLLSHSRNVPRK